MYLQRITELEYGVDYHKGEIYCGIYGDSPTAYMFQINGDKHVSSYLAFRNKQVNDYSISGGSIVSFSIFRPTNAQIAFYEKWIKGEIQRNQINPLDMPTREDAEMPNPDHIYTVF